MASNIPLAIADVELQLAAAVSVGTTTLTLNSANDDDGNALPAGLYCFTIDSGTSNKEYLIGQLNGVNVTSVKSVSRQGVETTGAARAHRVGAPCIVTNFATLQRVADILRGQLSLDGANPIIYDAEPTLADRKEVATVGYVLDTATGGTVAFDAQVITGTAGESIVAGDLIYFKTSDQEWYKTDADTAATVEGVQLGIALGAGSDGASISGGIQIAGTYTTSGLTAGATYYASNTAGAIASSAGTTSQIVGLALSTTKLLIIPRNPQSLTTREKDALAGGGDLGTPSTANKFMTQTGFQPALEDLYDAITFPVVRATNTNSANASSAVTQNAPTGTVSGDIVVVLLQIGSGASVSVAPSDYTLIGTPTQNLRLYAKIATGADNFSCTLSTALRDWATIAYRVDNTWNSATLTNIVKTTVGSDENTPNHAPDNSYSHYLWIAAVGHQDAGTYSAAPANFTNLLTTTTSGASANDRVGIASAVRSLRAIELNPGNFTESGTTTNSSSYTISIRGAATYLLA